MKKWIGRVIVCAIIVTVLFSVVVFSKTQRKENVLVWNFEYGMVSTDGGAYFNELLKKKGYGIEISFQRYTIDDYLNGKAITGLPKADLVTFPLDSAYESIYEKMALKGLLIPMDNYLMSPEGKKLYESIPDKTWDGVRVNGKIYGVINPLLSCNTYLLVNRELCEKYRIDAREINSETYWDCIESVYNLEKKAGNTDFYAMELFCLDRWEDVLLFRGSSGIGVYWDGDKWRADYLIHIPKWKEVHDTVSELVEKGVIGKDFNNNNENIFSMLVYSYSGEAALQYREKVNNIFDAVDVSAWMDNSYRGYGTKTAIISGSSNEEKAFELLKAIYTDPDLSNALVYGKEGRDYEIRNGKVYSFNGSTREAMGNPWIVIPSTRDGDCREDEINLMFQNDNSILCGFSFDPEGIWDDWKKVVDTYFEYRDVYYGEGDANRFADLQKELSSAYAYRVIQECNRQLEEFFACYDEGGVSYEDR